MMKTRYGVGLLAALTLVVAGCGSKDGDKKHESQTAAKVNGEEITVHQINHVVARLGKVPPEQAQQAAGQVLSGLVDKELLRQKAVEDKLDRKPEVVQALDAAKRDILAQAYLDAKVQSVGEPSDAEVQAYYTGHPELFSERKIYRLQEVVIQAGDRAAQVKQQIQDAKNVEKLADWLKAEKIAATGGNAVKAAEQLPLELLPKLANLKEGQSLLLENGGRLTLLLLLGVQAQPVDMAHAKPAIVQFLGNSKRQAIAKNELEALKKSAKIEYLGSFAEANKPQPVKPEAAAPAPAAQGNAMEKGIAGLK